MLGFAPLASTPLADDLTEFSSAACAVSGSASVNGVGKPLATGVVSIDGLAVVSASGLSIAEAALSANGIADVSGVGFSTAEATLLADEAAIFLADGFSTAESNFTFVGEAVVQWRGRAVRIRFIPNTANDARWLNAQNNAAWIDTSTRFGT